MRSTAAEIVHVLRIIQAKCVHAATYRSDKAKARRIASIIRVGTVVHHDLAVRRSSSFDEFVCDALQRGIKLRFAVKAASPRVCNVFGNLSFLRPQAARCSSFMPGK